MFKMNLFVTFLSFLSLSVASQDKLEVQGASPNLYLEHTVTPRETWYSVGRLYNLNPKELATYNKTSINRLLSVNQKLKIPLTSNNFSQDGNKGPGEVFVPVYHTVQDKEWMYRISVNHNKVPIANLEKWNGINNAQLKQGVNLVVGYLKVKQGQSALAVSGVNKIKEITPIAKKNQQEEEINKDATAIVKEESKKDKTSPEVKEDTKQTVIEAVNTTNNRRGGYFRSKYHESNSGTAGNAGIFKSTSGWNDGKYYALMNNVPIGTIIKVTFSSTNKSVYAKVLGQLPEMRESMGLTLRLSDAAASELGISMNKFYVDVKY
jgi:LysM repeat protein